MNRKDWTELAMIYEHDGRPGFVIDSLLARGMRS